MSSFSYEERQVGHTGQRKTGLIFLEDMLGQLSSDMLLAQKAEQLCRTEGINYKGLEPIQRLFLTHYRCPGCKLLPLYYLNLTHPKRVRCGKCGELISFTNSGKYGKLRKKIAFMLWFATKGKASIP